MLAAACDARYARGSERTRWRVDSRARTPRRQSSPPVWRCAVARAERALKQPSARSRGRAASVFTRANSPNGPSCASKPQVVRATFKTTFKTTAQATAAPDKVVPTYSTLPSPAESLASAAHASNASCRWARATSRAPRGKAGECARRWRLLVCMLSGDVCLRCRLRALDCPGRAGSAGAERADGRADRRRDETLLRARARARLVRPPQRAAGALLLDLTPSHTLSPPRRTPKRRHRPR